MRISTVASGSSGNCVYVGSDNTHVLVDVGISGKRTEQGLNDNGISIKDISAILITHEHIDHINGLGVISRKYEIPIYTTKGTADAIKMNKKIGRIPDDLYVNIEADSPFNIGDLEVCPFNISHDAAQPVAYRFNNGSKSVAVATDMGKYDDYIVNNLKKLDAILIEANHDIRMLLAGAYPYYLKQRILGDRGHLSNEASGKLINDILHDGLKYILLGHLSKENNYEDLAYETVKSEIAISDNKYKADDFNITVAKRDVNSALFCV
jgi:phosphoribosyl 1,2-cyclic phosphodiesterase